MHPLSERFVKLQKGVQKELRVREEIKNKKDPLSFEEISKLVKEVRRKIL